MIVSKYVFLTHALKKSMLGTVYFLKIAKINSQQKKKQYVLIAKISPRITQKKIASPQKFRAMHTVVKTAL